MKRFYWRANGRVQGVGFRYTVQRHASLLGLTGWVRNEPDGAVAIEVQGEEDTIDDLRQYLLKDHRFIKVDDLEEKEIECVHGEPDFDITY